MRRALAVCLLAGATTAHACGEGLAGAKRTLRNDDYSIAYVTTPARIAVGEHFAIDFAVCPRAAAAAPRSVRVDANMPEHRHGMNYRASVTRPAPGRYRAQGLLFHMPGRWEITFDVVTARASQRLADPVRIE